MSDTAVPLDLELRLGWGPRDVAPRSNSGTAAEGIRNGPGYGETRQRVEQAVGPMSDHGRTEQPTSAAAKVILPPPQVVQLAGSSSAHKRKRQEAGDDEAAAAETGSKRAKTEPPPATVDDLTAPLFVQHVRASPPAARGAPRRGQRKKCSLNPPAAHHQGDGGATEPAWVRAELLTRHALPGDLPLHFVQEKELTGSDLKSEHSRLLIQSDGSKRLCALLSVDERRQCGLDGNRRRKKKPAQCQDGAKKEREKQTKYPGVPVLIYERGGERAAAALRLNSFNSTKTMVINGKGYGRFVAGSGFAKDNCVEVWAFRRPHDKHLCFVIAKRDDDDRRAAINRQ